MESVLNFVMNSAEVRGWHSGTAISVIINLLTLNQAWATAGQARRIFRTRSGLGVSVITMTFYAFYFPAFMLYGIHKGALNMVLNASQFIIYIPLLFGLWKFGDVHTKRTMRFCVPAFALLPLIMYIVTWKETFLLILFAGILLTILLMLKELRNIQGTGSFEIKFAIAFLVNALFWFLYGMSLRDIPLLIFNPLAAILLSMVIVLYMKKRRTISI